MDTRARLRRLVATGALAALGATSTVVVAPAASGAAGFTFARFAGADRYDTAARTATGTFATADTVLIARGNAFPDALAGNFLAGQGTGGPILLTLQDQVPQATFGALSTLKTKNVILLGGTQAIGANVSAQLAATPSTSPSGGNLVVSRIGGTNRYDTARLAAELPNTTVGQIGGAPTAIVSSGANFPDALAGGPMAFASKFPVILTDPASLSPEAADALSTRAITRVLVLGGTLAVSSAVEAQIKSMNGGITTTRLAGADRNGTAAAIADFELSTLAFSNRHVNLATGADFADALAGGPHAGKEAAPVLLTATSTSLSTPTRTWLSGHAPTLVDGNIFGGLVAVGAAVEQAAVTAATTNGLEAFTVTPTGTATMTQSTSTTSGEGLRACSATVTTGTTTVDIALFPARNVAADASGNHVFADADANNLADFATKTTGGVVRTVNGAAQSSPSNFVAHASAVNGVVSFSIDSTSVDDVIAVVFADANANNALDLTGSGTVNKLPVELFGVGCRTRWFPPASGPTIQNGLVVAGVDKTAGFFWTTANTFTWHSGDQFQIGGASANAAQFTQAISAGDTVDVTPYTANASVPSAFNLHDTAPAPPIVTSASATDPHTISLGWNASTTPTTDTYRVRRSTVTNCGSNQVIATLSATATSFTDTGLSPSTPYWYTVSAMDQGSEHESGCQGPVTTPAAPPRILDVRVIASSGATLASGDKHQFVFDSAMNATTQTGKYRVQDGDGTLADIDCSAVGNSCSLNSGDVVFNGTTYHAGQVLTTTISTATQLAAGTTSGLQYPLTITALTVEFKSAGVGNPVVDLAGSPDKTIERDTTPPTILDVRATSDVGFRGVVDNGDVHRFIFSEPMNAATASSGTYTIRDGAGNTVTVVCGGAGTTCGLNGNPVTIGSTIYATGQVLSVTIGSVGSANVGYPATITAVTNMTDVQGNPLDLAGSADKVIEQAA